MIDGRWYQRNFSRETALELFDEARSFTEEVVINYMPEVAQAWPLGNELHNVHGFNPKGAIIHVSGSPSMWNTFHMHTRNSHSAHVIIMTGGRFKSLQGGRYELLEALPANILIPHPIMTPLPHSGFLSSKTWGIELRSCGKLRPYDGMNEPPPIMNVEETDTVFRRGLDDYPSKYKYYWRGDLWRKKFHGKVYGWEGFYYELPTIAQIETLLVILMAMNKIADGFDRRFVIPSNCVHQQLPVLPIIPWTDFRNVVTTNWNNYQTPKFVETLFYKKHELYTFEADDIDYYDEGTIGEQLDIHRWRTYANNGELEYLNLDPEEPAINNIVTRKKIKHYSPLMRLGYDSRYIKSAENLYAISRGLTTASRQDILSSIGQEIHVC